MLNSIHFKIKKDIVVLQPILFFLKNNRFVLLPIYFYFIKSRVEFKPPICFLFYKMFELEQAVFCSRKL